VRIRLLLAGLLVAIAGLVAFEGVAVAQTKPNKEARECIEKLEKGGKIDDCQKAPSPILPATNELIWGSLSFVILLYALRRFGYPAVKKGMDDRAERIRNSLDEAERAKTEASQVLEEYQRQLQDARSEAARIIEEARQAADAVRRELIAKAEADAQQRVGQAEETIRAQVERTTAELRAQVAALAMEAAEMVLQRQLQDRDTQFQLVEDYINQVGARG